MPRFLHDKIRAGVVKAHPHYTEDEIEREVNATLDTIKKKKTDMSRYYGTQNKASITHTQKAKKKKFLGVDI